jgi:hypothetical protein
LSGPPTGEIDITPDPHEPPGQGAAIRRARTDRRQAWTFLTLLTVLLLVGVGALGTWLQWWTIGGGPSAAPAPPTCPTQTMVEPRATSLRVLNGTKRRGLARAVARELQVRTFRVASIDTERRKKSLTVVAELRYGPAGAKSATTVATQFHAPVKKTKIKRKGKTVDVVLGTKYKAMVERKKALKAVALKPEPEGCVAPTTTPKPTASPTPKPTASAKPSAEPS